jgi:hypothetical protein
VCLTSYELENIRILLGTKILYDVLFVANFLSVRSKYKDIGIAINHLKDLITYLKKL